MSRPPDDDFLSRWSRRKQEAREAPEPEPESPPSEPETPDERTDEEILEDLGLPDPDSLGPGSDFRAFMAAAVPDRIRRRALRKLWLSNPALANLDELVDYGQDFTDSATVVANIQSAYQAGRGYFDKLAREAEKAAADEKPVADPADPAGDPSREQSAGNEAETPSEPAGRAEEDNDPDTAESVAKTDAEEALPPRRRRMKFDFGEG